MLNHRKIYIAYFLYLVSNYIILALSRTREYYADEFSVEETKNPKVQPPKVY